MVQRVVYTIRWQKASSSWYCPETYAAKYEHKAAFVRLMARTLKDAWENEGKLGQLRIFGKNGRIQSERTYGRDPRRFPG